MSQDLPAAINHLSLARQYIGADGRLPAAGKVQAALGDLMDALAALDSPDPNGPMTDEQRRALFAAWRDADLSERQVDRHDFTRTVLDTTGKVSWARSGSGALTAGQADRLLEVLRMLKRVR